LPTENENNRITQVKNSSPQSEQNITNKEVASHLATIAARAPNVIDAAAVIAGPYAVVGIDVDKDIDSSKVGTIKYSVIETLQHDPYGKTAVVIADGEIGRASCRERGGTGTAERGRPYQGVNDK